MLKRLFFLILPLGISLPLMAAQCTMQPAPIDVSRIARAPAIQSYVVHKNKLALTALLKNGGALRLVHMGCEHSGASATLWFDSTLTLSDSKGWSKEIAQLARLAFTPVVANDIIAGLKSGRVETEQSEAGVVITAAPTEFMNYSITVSPTERGFMLTIAYSLG